MTGITCHPLPLVYDSSYMRADDSSYYLRVIAVVTCGWMVRISQAGSVGSRMAITEVEMPTAPATIQTRRSDSRLHQEGDESSSSGSFGSSVTGSGCSCRYCTAGHGTQSGTAPLYTGTRPNTAPLYVHGTQSELSKLQTKEIVIKWLGLFCVFLFSQFCNCLHTM